MQQTKEETKDYVGLYLRVSSQDQKREGLSLSAQENKLKEYCNFHNKKIFKIYSDEGISAGSIKKRPGMKQMLEDAKAHKFSAILVTKIDRGFRNVKEAIITLDELKSYNIDFISLSENIDTTTPMGKFFFIVISAFAELERGLTTDRVKEILIHKFNSGLPIGKIPFGYTAIYKTINGKKIMTNIALEPKESAIVKDIFEMTANKQGYKEICLKYKIKPQSYYNIIRNKFYIGFLTFGKETKENTHPPIISKELWEKVNGKM